MDRILILFHGMKKLHYMKSFSFLLMPIISILSSIFSVFYRAYAYNREKQIKKVLGGESRSIAWPFTLQGVQNFEFSDNVGIGPGATIYSTRAKLIIKEHVVIGPNLTIITGDHMPILGRYIDTVRDEEKLPEYDQDVVIECDVWIGCNVTILKGVIIGRGSIVAAGSVVTKSCPPYSIIGGVPAKVIKILYTQEEIIEHERLLSRFK